jgi:hypothetical protein
LRKAAFAPVLAAILAALAGALAQPRGAAAATRLYPSSEAVVKKIELYRNTTWRWQRVMGLRPTPTSSTPPPRPSLRYRLWVLSLWKTRALKMERLALNPPHKAEWLCIHRYEGSWADASGPYYGGLQMDITFQRHYGVTLLTRKGTAEHWTPLEQMWVAERALRSGRGFYPWPNTARYCGLI